jgi:Fe2+ or Zn2+ uptake regulation protein
MYNSKTLMKQGAHSLEQPCDDTSCQDCCQHDEVDHFICMDCGFELDPGEFIDKAMDYYEDGD